VGPVGESSTEEEADAGAITQEINEMPNGVAEPIYRRYYTQPGDCACELRDADRAGIEP
jgi:hypothetical protein